MANLNEIVDMISLKVDKPFDHALRQVLKERVLQLRSLIIRRSTQKHGLDEELKMSVDLPLVKVDELDSCAIQLNCVVARTKNKVPVPVRLSRGVPFDFVGTLLGVPYSFTRYGEHGVLNYIPIRKSMRGYFINNGYIYLVNHLKENIIRVRHVFENVEEAATFCEENCIHENVDIFLPGDIIFDIVTTLVGEVLNNPRYRELQIPTNDDTHIRNS